MRVAVFVSGRGSNLLRLIEAQRANELGAATIDLVVSNRPDAAALTIARAHGLAATCIPHREFTSRTLFENELLSALEPRRIEAIVLAGFMRVLSPHFLATFSGPIVNTHPSLLPAFPGAHAVRDALAYGVKVSGVTVHFVDESLDGGPIIAQACVDVAEHDTEESLAARILAAEHALLPQVVASLSRGDYLREGRRVVITEGKCATTI